MIRSNSIASRTTSTTPAATAATVAAAALAMLAAVGGTGCASVSPPFNTMKDAQMTVYRLQNFEPPAQAQTPASPLGVLPAQIQQWISAGASLLPQGLLPPGILPGSTPAPAAADAQRFHNFRILAWQPVTDASVRGDIVDLFGHGANFQNTASNCMFAEFGVSIAQSNAPVPADILVSLSCEQTQAFDFAWPYQQTGLTADSSKKFVAIAQRVFQGH